VSIGQRVVLQIRHLDCSSSSTNATHQAKPAANTVISKGEIIKPQPFTFFQVSIAKSKSATAAAERQLLQPSGKVPHCRQSGHNLVRLPPGSKHFHPNSTGELWQHVHQHTQCSTTTCHDIYIAMMGHFHLISGGLHSLGTPCAKLSPQTWSLAS